MNYLDQAQYLSNLNQYGFSEYDCLSDIILHVHNEDNLFFRVGTWDEVLTPINTAVGTGLVCLQDMTALAKHIKLNEMPENANLQVISGRTFAAEGIGSPARGSGERFVYEPELALETDLPTIEELRKEYADLIKNGGIVEKEPVQHIYSEDLLTPTPKDKLPEPKQKLIHYEPERMSSAVFVTNWNYLVARKNLNDKGRLTAEMKERYPITPNFKAWAERNWSVVSQKLNQPDTSPETLHPRDSVQDRLNQQLHRNPYIGKMGLFPHSRQTDEYWELLRKCEVWIEFNKPINGKRGKYVSAWDEYIRRVDAEIQANNPGTQMYSQPDVDENGEYVEMPELIGDVENPQCAGIDENGDDVYNDFDSDGAFLPMGNANNSTDYQDDFDPQEHASESWNSIDLIDDHHTDEYYYREVGITEQPSFQEDGQIEWVTESYSTDVDEKVHTTDDVDFVKDARNWLTRENLLREAQNEHATEEIHRGYPVSPRLPQIRGKERDRLGKS